MLEREYFYKKDRKLIDQLQEEARREADEAEKSTHLKQVCSIVALG